jgi:hypothetical protein
MGLADEGTQGVRLAQPAKAGHWKGHNKGSLAALSRVLTQRRKEVPRDANMDQAHLINSQLLVELHHRYSEDLERH